MRKYLLLAMVLLATLFLLCACGGTAELQTETDPFVRVYGKGMSSYHVVYDRETFVMYAVSNGGYNAGTFTVLLNSDGTPKLYQPKYY